VLLVGLANLGGVALEGREGDFKPPLFAPLAHRNAGFGVDQLRTLSSGGLRPGAVAFRLFRFRLLDLPQGGVDRGSQFLDVSRDQVRAELSLCVLVQRLDKRLLRRLLRVGSLRQPDQPLEAAAPALCPLAFRSGYETCSGSGLPSIDVFLIPVHSAGL